VINAEKNDENLLAMLLRLKHFVQVTFDTDLKRFLKCAICQSRLPLGFSTDYIGWTVFGND
jgi:hypothetical protein